jgi:CRP-like cAMP-binding protein
LASRENHLIKRLPRAARKRLLHMCEPIHLVHGEILGYQGTPTRHVYFPVDSYISVETSMDGKPVLEVGMVGREGMLGAHLALGVANDSLHSVVQAPGLARRIPTGAFRRELSQNVALQHSLNHYIYVLMAQMASSAACLRFHLIGPRLARWLLMSHDRAHSDSFSVTQPFLAHMLGVRRGAISAAAGQLQRRNVIAYSRGDITVLNRAALEAASCRCYVAERQTYSRSLN